MKEKAGGEQCRTGTRHPLRIERGSDRRAGQGAEEQDRQGEMTDQGGQHPDRLSPEIQRIIYSETLRI